MFLYAAAALSLILQPVVSPLSGNTAFDTKATYEEAQTRSRTYIRGPRGGCYYINKNGNRTYVDRSLCARRS